MLWSLFVDVVVLGGGSGFVCCWRLWWLSLVSFMVVVFYGGGCDCGGSGSLWWLCLFLVVGLWWCCVYWRWLCSVAEVVIVMVVCDGFCLR